MLVRRRDLFDLAAYYSVTLLALTSSKVFQAFFFFLFTFFLSKNPYFELARPVEMPGSGDCLNFNKFVFVNAFLVDIAFNSHQQ